LFIVLANVNRSNLLALSISIILLILTTFVINLGGTAQRAYADGLTQENLPPAT
jgi:hypothetical protein